jgi:cytochrome o ubiquinol oxidase subunit 2
MIINKHFKLSGLIPLFAAVLLTGCDMALMNPKGQIGMEQKSLIITATWLMLIVVIPVIFMTVYFAWKFRASNDKAEYAPEWSHSRKIEAIVWAVPCVIILILSTITWYSTHELDPRKPLVSDQKPITIQVVAMDWKWLFIYPELNIATVNQISFPVNVPAEFKITSATVMNSFFIPRLGSQLYAMAGMENRLNLIANEPGTYQGLSSNYSGAGFSGMKFSVLATSQAEFDQWVANVRQSPQQLTTASYDQLTAETINHPVQYYSAVKPGIYSDIIHQFMSPGMHGASDAGQPADRQADNAMPPMHAQHSMTGE